MDNYRPLSILKVVSKILERVVQKQLLGYLETTYQLSPHQFGFCKHHSTQDAVTYFTDQIRPWMSNRSGVHCPICVRRLIL